MDYILIRSRRKSISIHITKDAVVEVRAPMKAPKAQIDKLLLSKQGWIEKNLSEQSLSLAVRKEFSPFYGDKVLFRGREYTIIPRVGRSAGVDGSCFFLPEGLDRDSVKTSLIKLYKILAKGLLNERVARYAAIMGVTPTAVSINSAKTRWGSCSGKNRINFSWRLALAEDSAIDYVVVHELAHIIRHDHSAGFWAVVEGVFSDYKERQKQLLSLQKRLSVEDWD